MRRRDGIRRIRWMVLASILAGCGTVSEVYTVQPMPVVVHPADEPWGVEVSLELREAIHVGIANTSGEPVRVLWTECAYLDVDGRTHRLSMRRGRRVMNPDALVPTLVAPGMRVEETLFPAETRAMNGNDPLLPGTRKAAESRGFLRRFWPFRQPDAPHPAVGKTIGVLLVLERGGTQRTLQVTYAITGVHKERLG